MAIFVQDLRYALRTLRRNPGFTAIAILCLTLGVAVNTTIYSVVDAILLRPFPYDKPEQLVYLQEVQQRTGGDASISYKNFEDWRDQAKSLSAITVVTTRSMTLSDGEEPERLVGGAISWNLFPMLGVRPQLGRWFRADEDKVGATAVALLSDEVWRRRYNADSAIVGRSIPINGAPHTVVGVMPPRFLFPEDHQIWTPVAPIAGDEPRNRRGYVAFGRLAPGAGIEQANREIAAISTRLATQYGTQAEGWTGNVIDLRDEFIPDDIRLLVLTMMGAVTFVLLIACANVANLMLARATARAREIAIRAAVGAGRGRIVRQLLTESVLIALAAGLIAVPLTWWGLRLLDGAIPPDDPIPYYIDWRLDVRVLIYTTIVSVVTGVLFGLAPALQASRGELQEALRDGGRGSGSGAVRHRLRNGLVVVEVALSLVLLVGASLFVRSFIKLQNVGVGFDTERIMTMRFFLPGAPYDGTTAKGQRVEDIVRRVEALPGVQAATISNMVPLGNGGNGDGIIMEGRDVVRGEEPLVSWSGVSAHWFQTLGVAVRQGRVFTDAEGADSTPVAVVSESMAKVLSPDGNALGRRFRFAGDTSRVWFTVIGVSSDFRVNDVDDTQRDRSVAFVPYKFVPARNNGLMVRVAGDPSAITNAVREQIRASDASLPVFEVQSMDAVRRLSFWEFGLFGSMFSIFGGIALFLAAIGVYGVISFGVTQRTQEIGVRVALGAQRGDVMRLVVRQGLILALAGIAFGIVGAFAVTRVVTSLLYEVSANDPLSYGLVSLFLTLTALIASWIPARRAMKVDPIVALRFD